MAFPCGRSSDDFHKLALAEYDEGRAACAAGRPYCQAASAAWRKGYKVEAEFMAAVERSLEAAREYPQDRSELYGLVAAEEPPHSDAPNL